MSTYIVVQTINFLWNVANMDQPLCPAQRTLDKAITVHYVLALFFHHFLFPVDIQFRGPGGYDEAQYEWHIRPTGEQAAVLML